MNEDIILQLGRERETSIRDVNEGEGFQRMESLEPPESDH